MLVQARPPETDCAVRVRLFKGFELTLGGRAVAISLGAQQLIVFLALHDRLLPRARVAGSLWPDVTDERAAGNLRSTIWRIRRIQDDLLQSKHDYIGLSHTVIVDLREVDRIAHVLIDRNSDISGITFEDIALVDELLPGWYADWIVLERERQRQICLHALEAACERWTSAGQYANAVMAGLAAVASEPLRESAHRVLMKAYLAEGNPGEAIRQYSAFRTVLMRELQLEPSPQIRELVADILL